MDTDWGVPAMCAAHRGARPFVAAAERSSTLTEHFLTAISESSDGKKSARYWHDEMRPRLCPAGRGRDW